MRNMALKLRQYFYLLMEKPLGRHFRVRSLYYQVAQCNQKTLILVSLRWQVLSKKAKKRISIDTNHSYHQHSSPKISFIWSIDSDQFYLIVKDGVQDWSM